MFAFGEGLLWIDFKNGRHGEGEKESGRIRVKVPLLGVVRGGFIIL